jgi:SSS family solute:Na+ symporter
VALTLLDWSLLVGYFVASFAVGFYFYRRASGGVVEFFLSGRQLPWWLAGTSMVATTFAADTPLAVAGFVGTSGIAGNWIWWNMALGAMLTVFLFARLWRRAGILTDVELAEVRYSGRPAAVLRGFRAVYLGLLVNCLIIGWVNLAMAKILRVVLGWNRPTAVLVGLGVTGLYSAVSGLWGVVVTDFFQFALAMLGTIAVAYFALAQPQVGGLAGLPDRLPAPALNFFPVVADATEADAYVLALPLAAFVAYVGVQWWASWYPGAEPGGGGYVAQRLMSARDERESLLAALWFTLAHYCLRPWPWILAGLACIVLYPDVADRELRYVMLMRDYLPAGWRGFLLAAFFAAYMSTVATQLNWGTSYLVNDLYRRFFVREAPERHYVWAARVATLLLMMLGGLVTFVLETVGQAWQFLLESGAGVGAVLILRWYWWRVNAWSEIAAMVAPVVGLAVLKAFTDVQFPWTLLYLVPWTTACWLAITWLTPPEPEARLVAFYRRVRPGGRGWAPIAARAGDASPEPLGPALVEWVLGCVLVYACLFGLGALLVRSIGAAVPYTLVAATSALLLWRRLGTERAGAR